MSKYKVGDKFILEIQDFSDEEYCEYPYETEVDYFCENELDKLPQLVKGVDTYSYNKGAEDAWELAGLIGKLESDGGLDIDILNEIFGGGLMTKIFKMPYKEVKDKIESWKKAKEEIKQGDYVKSCGSITGIITKDSVAGDKSKCYVMWRDGSTGKRNKRDLKRIDNNSAIDDLEALLKKINGK